MLDLLWFNAEEETERFRKIEKIEWICPLRSAHLPWEGPEDMPLTNTVRNKCVRKPGTLEDLCDLSSMQFRLYNGNCSH